MRSIPASPSLRAPYKSIHTTVCQLHDAGRHIILPAVEAMVRNPSSLTGKNIRSGNPPVLISIIGSINTIQLSGPMCAVQPCDEKVIEFKPWTLTMGLLTKEIQKGGAK